MKRKKGTDGTLYALLTWITSTVVFLLLCAAAASKMAVHEKSLPYMSAAIVMLSSAAAARRLTRERETKRRGLLVGLVVSAVLLMLGFIVDSKGMTLSGLGRTVAAAMSGAALGAFVSGQVHAAGNGKRYSKGRNRH